MNIFKYFIIIIFGFVSFYNYSNDKNSRKLEVTFNKISKDTFQGKTFHVQFKVNKKIKEVTALAFSHKYNCVETSLNSQNYECFIPVGCAQQPKQYIIIFEAIDSGNNKIKFRKNVLVKKFPFKKQVLKIKSNIITKSKKKNLNGKTLDKILIKLSKDSPKNKLWKDKFHSPTPLTKPGRITSHFGTIRDSNHKGIYQHKGIDIANRPKCPVYAPADGIIVLKKKYAPTGNIIVIDHGCSILTLLMHLDSFADIKVGQKIKSGQLVGYEGKTGWVTGYHVHWEMRINNISIDPLQWINQDL